MNNSRVMVRSSNEHQLVEVVWKEHCEAEAFRGIMSEVMEYVRERGITKWLCDMRLLQYMLLSDHNWLTKVLLPAMPSREKEEYRFAYLISLTNLELMSNLGIQGSVQGNAQLKQNVELELFMSRDNALMWLN